MRTLLKLLLPAVGAGLLAYTWSVSIAANGGFAATFGVAGAALAFNLFRLAGLTAFTLVSFQVLTGPYMAFWERLYGKNFYRFHAYEGLFALFFALLHPILLYGYLFASDLGPLEFAKGYPFTYYFGPLALLTMVITVSTAASAVLLNHQFFQKRWHFIHLANYLVFLLVFFHSLTIGTDVAPATSALRALWWFYFAGMVVGLAYHRAYLPLKTKFAAMAPLR